MSKHPVDSDNGRLPLPAPRSPRELDERILARARAKAPEKRPAHTARWVGGLATTCVLVVAIYLTNTTETGLAPPLPEPAEMKEERSAGAAAPMASPARAKLKSSADFDNLAAEQASQAELPMAPEAEAMFDSAAGQAMQRADRAASNLQGTLQHLRELLARGETERALREYAELRNACSECGLPATLEEALESFERQP